MTVSYTHLDVYKRQTEYSVSLESAYSVLSHLDLHKFEVYMIGIKMCIRDRYKRMAQEAREEGFEELAIKFENVGKVERSHEARYLRLLKNYKEGKTFKGDAPKGWKCRQCGFIYEGEEAPERCPTCGYPKAYFERMTENY